MPVVTRSKRLEDKVKRAVELCWDETTTDNEGPKTYSFLATTFAQDGKELHGREVQMINHILSDARYVNLYGRYVTALQKSKHGDRLIFQPVADLEDIIELEL